jgi:hypothetical protein
MTQFNVHNSNVEQLNSTGNNIKLNSVHGNNTFVEKGNAVQASPLDERLFIDQIENFSKVQQITPTDVAPILADGRVDITEEDVQRGLEVILGVSFHKKDWGGEVNDLYTANVLVDGVRRPTAFLLKGNGLNKKTMEIRDCGKNGDQVVRLFQSPANLFVIQFVGNISEAVILHAQGEIARLKTKGCDAQFVIMDGQETARLLAAYGQTPLNTAALPDSGK